jgi:zinc transport system substrate-binding protein
MLRAGVLVLALLLAGCGAQGRSGPGKVTVAASFAPLAEVARRVGGDRVEVRDLTPPGAEPHDVELRPDDVAALADADLAVVVGGGFQPAVEDAADRRDGPTVRILAPGAADPHVWLDPTAMARITGRVATALARIDPSGAAGYRARARAWEAELEALDRAFAQGLAHCRSRVIVTTHAAFGALAKRYGLRQEAVVGSSPEAEPDPARLDELVDLVRREGVTTVFTEPLAPRRLAATLARETGADVAVLDPVETLARGADYVSVMRRNLAALRAALGCS